MTGAALSTFVIGCLVGGVLAWIIVSSRAKGAIDVNRELRRQIENKDIGLEALKNELDGIKAQWIRSDAELKESKKNLDEQKSLIEKMKKDMSDTFNALSAAALKSSSKEFLVLASERLERIVSDTKGKLGEHHEAISGLVKPLHEALRNYEKQILDIEKDRHRAYGSLEEHLKTLSSASQQLQQETSSLVTALRKPQVSGSWGQLSLKRAAELAGMTENCDFFEEVSVNTETGRLRPDMIVKLPNGRDIVVDAKAPVDAYMNALSAVSGEERSRGIKNYVSQIRKHMNSLGSKAYWDQFQKSPEMVVMYLPGESFFSVALEHDHKLIEDSSFKKIVLATPTTFIALLKAIAYGWQQEQITKNALKVSQLGKELHDRIAIMTKHVDAVGSALGKATIAYNRFIGSMESRILPAVRKFKDLGATTSDDIQELRPLEHTPREIAISGSNDDNDEIAT